MAAKSARSKFTLPFNPGRRRFIKILSSGSVVLLLYGCGLTPQSLTPTAAQDEEQTPGPAVEPEHISTIETELQQNPMYLMNNEQFRDLVQTEDPIALDFAAKMEELIHQNPDWQNKTMVDFDMSVMMLSGEGKQANEGQLYATIEGQTWILGRYREGVGIEPIVEPVVATQGHRGPLLEFGSTFLMEAATINNVKGVKAYRVDGSEVFSGESSLTETRVTQKQHAEAAMLPVVLPAEMKIATTQYADKKLTGFDKDGNMVAIYDVKNKEWRVTVPVYADWMAGHVEGLVGVWENQEAYLVKEMADGRRVKVFEHVDGEWRPAYGSMYLFVREDKTFDLETAQQTMFMRMGPVADVDGQPAMSVNMDDYQRFVTEMKSIARGLTGLGPSGFIGTGGGGLNYSILAVGPELAITIYEPGDQWQLIGWAKNPVGAESVFVVATSDGPIALLNVGHNGYNWADNDNVSVEEGVAKVADRSLDCGDNFRLFVDVRLNPDFRGEVDADKLSQMRAFVRGMGINGRELLSMMSGDYSRQRATLDYMFNHFPVVVEDFW